MQQSPLPLISTCPPYSWYRSMRETTPVSYMPQYKAWGVFCYDDIHQILSDPILFSSDRAARNAGLSSLTTTDPPRHSQLRNLVNQAFTPRSVTNLAPRITALVHEFLDAIKEQGEMDVVEDLAYPLPVTLISEVVGVPQKDHLQLQGWIEDFARSMRNGQGMQLPGLPPAMNMYFTNLIELRRKKPEDDLISRLIAAEIDGEHLGQQELIDFCFLVYAAGHSTTTDLIGNAVLCLIQHPEIQEELRAKPKLLPGAIEEILRYHPPVHSVSRAVTSDTMLGGQLLPKGEGVIAWIASANHDPAHFINPERFDITRTPNRHLSFGYTIHLCLGASLARLEAQITLQIMLERFSAFTLIPGVPLEMKQSPVIPGARHIPIMFQAL